MEREKEESVYERERHTQNDWEKEGGRGSRILLISLWC